MDAAADHVARTRAYYRERFERHGATPAGVDWNGTTTQRILFDQLLKLLPVGGRCSLNDFGCGYGALADELPGPCEHVAYTGYDVNPEMIAAAEARHAARADVTFVVADRPLAEADYGVASGVFTLRLGRDDETCNRDLVEALDAMNDTSRRGFGFNCLTSYSDVERMKDHLWYPDPCAVFDLCKRRYARNVALLHDYGLYGFTILVRKVVEETP